MILGGSSLTCTDSQTLGDDMLLQMTKDFEVLKDCRLRSDDFGEGKSRQTLPPQALSNF